MPTLIRKLTPDGLQPVAYTAASLSEAAQYEPHDGVYTVTNTYPVMQVLKFDAHLDRLEDSAARAGIPLRLDRAALRAALRTLITDSGFGEVRFRVTVPQATPEEFILSVEPFTPPAADLIERGVRVLTAADAARQNPAAKTTDWLHDRQALSAAMPAGIYDTILLDTAGYLLEGLAANFYAILNGELRTAGEGVLPGIARQIVLAVAPELLPVVMTPPHLSDLPQLTEAFITSSSRGIIPVVEIDGRTLGDGTPGPLTRRLRAAYTAWVAAHLEAL